jgi:hypothetical protein
MYCVYTSRKPVALVHNGLSTPKLVGLHPCGVEDGTLSWLSQRMTHHTAVPSFVVSDSIYAAGSTNLLAQCISMNLDLDSSYVQVFVITVMAISHKGEWSGWVPDDTLG